MDQAGGDYFSSKENVDPEEQLRIFCERVDAEQTQRDKELFEFLEELINSEEFRPRKDTKDASTQVLPLYLEKYAKETKELVRVLVDDYSLTKYYQKRHTEENLKIAKLNAIENKRIRAWQDEAIAIIKEHIFKAARQHACHLNERIAHKLNKIEKALGGVDYRPELKKKAVDYVISMKKIKHNQSIGRKQREVSIVNKLLAEKKRWKQIKALQNKTYDYKVKRREKPVVIEEIMPEESMLSGLEMGDEFYEEVLPLEEHIPSEVIKEEVDKAPAKQKKEKKGKKEKKDKKGTKEKGAKKDKKPTKDKKKDKKSKKDKKDKKSKKGKKDKKKDKNKTQPDLVLPEIPIINPREKIRPNDPELLLDIIRQHEELLMVLDQKNQFDAMFDEDELEYEKDLTCFWRPNPVLFDNFENGKCYKRHIAIINGGRHLKKIKLHSAIIEDGFDPYLICVDKFGMAVTVPGLSFDIVVTFRPRQLNQVTYGKLTFISCEASKSGYMQFSVPIKCVPFIKEVFVTPIHIRFGNLPFWETKNIKPKRLRVISTDTKLYRVAVKKILEESEMELISRSQTTSSLMNIVQILKEITEVCHHNFKLSKYFSELYPNSGFEIKIFPKHLDHVGTYYERYECQFFEETGNEITFIGCQECVVSAEITGHFIKVSPDILDFGVCSFGSVYQERFSIINEHGASHRVLLQFPTSLKPYLSSNMAEIIITSNSMREISLKFMPREDMTDGCLCCYDGETKILKFPVKAQVTTRDYDNIPLIKLTIYAILTENLGLSIRPLNLECAKRNGDDFLLDLGACLTRETVYAKIGITNSTATQQHYGFLDLPNCVTICPNYGFGYLDAYESKELLLQFSPENTDLSHYTTAELKQSLTFRISVTTLKHIGAVRKAFDYKRLRKSFQYMMDTLRNEVKDALVKDMVDGLEILSNSKEFVTARNAIGVDDYNIPQGSEAEGVLNPSEVELHSFVQDNRNFEQINSNKIWILAQVVDPPVSLSHQLVVFPSTPCGSFSTMRLQLRTSKRLKDDQCLCGYNSLKGHRQQTEEFEVHFEIRGDNPQITVEPICGDLVGGYCIDIHLTAKPEIPEEVIEEKARHIKTMQIIAEKRKEILFKRELERQARLIREQKAREKKQKKGNKGKEKKKKGKRGSEKSKTTLEAAQTEQKDDAEERDESEDEPLPEITVNPSEVRVNYFDLYPAEMVIWRDFEPKYIEANFIVEVTYSGENINKPKDYLYLRAICKVISPSFVHNLDRQRLDFGPTAIGASKRILLELQNIRDIAIEPRISLLSSDGVFLCPNVEVPVPAEHVLRIPITFKPVDDANVRILPLHFYHEHPYRCRDQNNQAEF